MMIGNTNNVSVPCTVFCCCDVIMQAYVDIYTQRNIQLEREHFHQRSLRQLSTVRQSHTTEIEESLDLLRQYPDVLDVVVTGEAMSRFYESEFVQRSVKWRSIDREQAVLMQQSHDRLQQLQLMETSLAILRQRFENGDQQQSVMILKAFVDTLNSLNTELTAAEQRRVVLEQSVMHAVTTENEQMLAMMALLTRYGAYGRSPSAIPCC